MRPIVWKSSSRARSSGRRWLRSFPAATSACSMVCREAPVEYWVSILMSVTCTPFGRTTCVVSGMPYEVLPAWEHQRRGCARVAGAHERDHRAAIGGTQQRGNGGRGGRPHQLGNGARGGRAHQRAGASVVGGTHEWDRCPSLIGSVRDEPGRGGLQDLDF